jgi:hypothetical protein
MEQRQVTRHIDNRFNTIHSWYRRYINRAPWLAPAEKEKIRPSPIR